MRALARLLLIFQGATRLQRWLSVCGVVLVVIGAGEQIGYGLGPGGSGSALGWLALVLGILGLIFGGAMMPIVFGALAAGHQLHLLPHGRGKLLSSAIATLILPALVCAATVMTIFLPYPVDHAAAFYKTLLVTFATFTLMSVVIGFVSRARSAFGVLGGVMLLIGCLSLPVRFIDLPNTSIRWIAVGTGVLYGAAAAAFLCLERLRAALQAARSRLRRTAVRSPHRAAPSEYSPGEETALLLGTANPWPLALGQAFPLLAATLFISEPRVWLFYFALCSALTGAIASTAAARSRCLWLRTQWSRAELFGHVEVGFLRQNAYSVSVLLVLLVAIGSYREFSTALLALGIPLLLVGTAASTYLGLMMTRGMRWLDGGCAVLTMTAIMAAAVYARGGRTDQQLVMGLEVLLAALAVSFRALAMRRWRSLDWLMCRSERTARQAR